MKTFFSTLAITLAVSFMATPAEALDNLAKCHVHNAKIKMNYAKCLELDNLLAEKGKVPKGDCDSKRTASLEKATAKFVTKLDVNAAACGMDTPTTEADQALQLLASSDGSLTADQEAALAGTAADITSDNASIAAAAEQAGCEAAGGTWENDACAESYNCAIGAMCSYWAEAYPEDLQYYTNNYIGDTAASTGCPYYAWDFAQNRWGRYNQSLSQSLQDYARWGITCVKN